MNLVIVESPTKAKTIGKYLGSNYVVKASYGHVVDLPKKTLGVDVANNFTPTYEVTVRGKKTLAELNKLVKDAKAIYIATDPDREGEAIGANVKAQMTNIKSMSKLKFYRITFHEITKEAINEAINHPSEINASLVDSQQARRVLDRLVGYKLSPLLWKKVRYGLSAGRVQSVAVRLIVERERERKKFKAQEYWEFEGGFASQNSELKTGKKNTLLSAQLKKINGQEFLISSEKEATELVGELKSLAYKVALVDTKEVKKYAHPPFTTSTLQQAASNLLGFSAKRTMSAAQKLYEEGLITYHRTDSLSLSASFIEAARKYIAQKHGKDFVPEKPVFYKTKSKNAQEAHEAVRPTDVAVTNYTHKSHKTNETYAEDLEKLYNLIWRRAVSCQMVPAVYDQLVVKIQSVGDKFLFVSSEQQLKFSGFLEVYHGSVLSNNPKTPNSPNVLGVFSPNTPLSLLSITPSQHFTQPPARFSTASLVKALEDYGIGRPSTYASIISTIEGRGYLLREGKYFYPDDVAYVVTDLLVANFPEIVDVKFTAHMEGDLDSIAQGKVQWVPVIKEFWEPFFKDLEKAEANLKKADFTMLGTTEEKCPDCGSNLVIKLGRYGKFLSCSKFPECKFLKPLVEDVGQDCPECKKGRVLVRRTKKGKTFYGCSRYPDCKWASWTKPNDGSKQQLETGDN